jgi:hypothetical protein
MVMLSAPPTPAPAAPSRRGIKDLVGNPPAFALNGSPSRNSKGAKTGAGEGIRTLDPDLGKVVLYP